MKDVVMAIFGLSHTVNTKVGNDFIRGVSGGEMRRISIGLELIGRPEILILDEPVSLLNTVEVICLPKLLVPSDIWS